MVVIKLEHYEVRYAKHIALLRTESRRTSSNDRNEKIKVFDRNRVDEIGALGEFAACKALNKHWMNAFIKGSFKRPDVAGFEVKTTTRKSKELLIGKSTPSNAKILSLFLKSDSVFEVRGWQYARECMKVEYWNEKMPLPCYAYPDRLLREFI